MSFHPRMYADVRGIEPIAELKSITFPEMAMDLWIVQAQNGASGDYVSPHPRIVVLLDGRSLALRATKDGDWQNCAAFYIPAGVRYWASLNRADRLRHLDIHLHRSKLAAVLPKGADLRKPILHSSAEPVSGQAMRLAEICRAKHHTCNPRDVEDLVRAVFCKELFGESWRSPVEAYIAANLNTAISIDQLASVAGVSRAQFNRQFRRDMGISAYQYVLKCRVRYAERLIRDNLGLADIASLAGFADQAHFSRCFKRINGVTPTAWARSECSRQNSR
ncbi:MAG: AraC family transcriptional regulator [Pseudomonadota bacterium]